MRFWKPRRLHAEDMQLILRRIDKLMSEAETRLEASVARIVADAATEIRNHPAAQNDDGQLNALADKLDAASASLEAENPSDQAQPPAPPFAPPPPADQTGSPDTPPASGDGSAA